MAGEIQLDSTTFATESSGSITAELDTIRPNTTNGSLTLQGDSSDAGVTGLTIDSSGNATFAQTITGGTIGSGVQFPVGHVIQVKTSILTTDKSSTSTLGESINAGFAVTLTDCVSGNLIISYLMGGQLAMTGSTAGYRVQLFCSIEGVDVYGQFNKNYAEQSSGGSASYSGAAVSNMFFHTILSSGSIGVIPKIRVQNASFAGTLFADDGTSGSSSDSGPCRLTVMEIKQ